MPVKPSTPATRATTKKISAHLSMTVSFRDAEALPRERRQCRAVPARSVRTRVLPGRAGPRRGRVLGGGEVPVRQGVEPGFQEAFPLVLVGQVVGVLPKIARQQGDQALMSEGVVSVMGGQHA